MKVEVGLAPFLVYKDCISCFWGVYVQKILIYVD